MGSANMDIKELNDNQLVREYVSHAREILEELQQGRLYVPTADGIDLTVVQTYNQILQECINRHLDGGVYEEDEWSPDNEETHHAGATTSIQCDGRCICRGEQSSAERNSHCSGCASGGVHVDHGAGDNGTERARARSRDFTCSRQRALCSSNFRR